ncbi:MAG: ABC transporter permease [Candidatus Lokiarchaeota archaeon]|nr:ABC transporter permease [Candidatus Lokiarchaeota archaeon]
MSLIKFIIKRIIAIIPVLAGVLILTFFLSRMMPGDPVLGYLRGAGNPNLYRYYYHQLWLDRPIFVQFFKYISDVFSGNWGYSVSIMMGQDVWSLIMLRLPRTIDIAIFSILIAGFLGIKTGVLSAKYRNKPQDTILRFVALIGVSIPVFYMGVMLQYSLGYVIPIFPAVGFKNIEYSDPEFISGFRIIDAFLTGKIYIIFDYLYHLILPIFCLSFITLAGITRHTRSSMLEVLEQDFIRTARAKGCKEKDVIHKHALRNALIPTTTIIGLSMTELLAGTVLIEYTFSLKGIGQLLVNAIFVADYWVINALVFIISFIFVFINLVVDLLYAILDPRIRY